MPAISEIFRRTSRSSVIPAKAGIQVRFASTANEKRLDSRLRGNDGREN